MARKPSRRKAAKSPRNQERSRNGGSDRERIIRAFMALLALKPIQRISLSEIAERAGVPLVRLRDEFDSALAILAAQMKEIDRAVLEGGDEDLAEESPRDRLFDVLMRRLEALAPHKSAVRSLMRSALCDPGFALALNSLSVRSQRWMLTAAGIGVAGPKGVLRAQGMALIFGRVLRVWLEDEDPGLSRTMAALDRSLERGQRWSGLLDDLCAFTPPHCAPRRRRRRDASDEAATAA